MPMAFRPGTTATRQATALIERAMSSDSPITREDLMPGAGSKLIERNHRARVRVDDLALDAEIVEHAFQDAGILRKRRR